MEIKYFDANQVKEKFALLIARLHDAGLPIDYINQVIVKSSFFDCFEKNDLESFMKMSIESISETVFGKECLVDYSRNLDSAYYWAGLSTMEIMMNLNVPLKRILLLMPLRKMIAHFDVHHEMHPLEFLNLYQTIENSNSVLLALREETWISISRVSFLTEIKQPLLNAIERSNVALFATSFANLDKLAKLFNVSIDVFKKKSSYVPFSNSIMKNKEFESLFVKNILNYFNFAEDSTYCVSQTYIDDKESRSILVNNKYIVDLSNPFGVTYISSNRITRRYLTREEFSFLYQKTINSLKPTFEGLLF